MDGPTNRPDRAERKSAHRLLSWTWPLWPALVAGLLYWRTDDSNSGLPPAAVNSPRPIRDGMVRLPGGRFSMGCDQAPAADARPAHDVVISPFWLDERPVTNAQFARFVEATDYITTAEQRGRADVFDPNAKRWTNRDGAQWRQPGGPDTTITGRDDDPVVQVGWHDAMAYAAWASKRLPTEAEWEYAARGGLHDADYPWGREELVDGRYYANYWQGRFPFNDEGDDGFRQIAPVGSYPANPFGLLDMAGNVWQWCADWYDADYYRESPSDDPAGAAHGRHRVARGGSWLSARHTYHGCRVWARRHLAAGGCDNQTGFRCARDGVL